MRPRGSTHFFDYAMTKFFVNKINAWKIDFNLFSITRPRWLTHCINYQFMCLSTHWQWKLANECSRISIVIVKLKFVQLDLTSLVHIRRCGKNLIKFVEGQFDKNTWTAMNHLKLKTTISLGVLLFLSKNLIVVREFSEVDFSLITGSGIKQWYSWTNLLLFLFVPSYWDGDKTHQIVAWTLFTHSSDLMDHFLFFIPHPDITLVSLTI